MLVFFLNFADHLCVQIIVNVYVCSGPCKRNRDVVLVRRIFGPGKPRGVGNLGWGGDGEGMERGRSVYE